MHSFSRLHQLHREGTVDVEIPDNAEILGLTAINNGPALVLGLHGPSSPHKARYRITVTELNIGADYASDPNGEDIGHATSGARVWTASRANAS